MDKEYMGDGLYVEICNDDNTVLKITSENGAEILATIYLEKRVFNMLCDYVIRKKSLIEYRDI